MPLVWSERTQINKLYTYLFTYSCVVSVMKENHNWQWKITGGSYLVWDIKETFSEKDLGVDTWQVRRLAAWVRERIPLWRMVHGAEGTEQWRNWANSKEGKSQLAEARKQSRRGGGWEAPIEKLGSDNPGTLCPSLRIWGFKIIKAFWARQWLDYSVCVSKIIRFFIF